jgi:hypothetical protein
MSNTRNKAIRGQDVVLSIQYYGIDGLPTNTDSIPEIPIKDLNSTLVIGPTSNGVSRVDIGLYNYTYSVPKLGDKGNWTDTWNASVSGINVQNVFQFCFIFFKSDISLLHINNCKSVLKLFSKRNNPQNWQIQPKEENQLNCSDVHIFVDTCDIVLFPSNLSHSVPPSNTDYTRISIAFNSFPSGDIGFIDGRLKGINFVKLDINNQKEHYGK